MSTYSDMCVIYPEGIIQNIFNPKYSKHTPIFDCVLCIWQWIYLTSVLEDLHGLSKLQTGIFSETTLASRHHRHG